MLLSFGARDEGFLMCSIEAFGGQSMFFFPFWWSAQATPFGKVLIPFLVFCEIARITVDQEKKKTETLKAE